MFTKLLTKIDAGYDEEFVIEFYETSPSDLALFYDQEFRELSREAYPIYTRQGYIPYVKTELIEVSKWEKYLSGVKCPVTLVQGIEDPVFPLSTIQDFVRGKTNFTIVPCANAGQLVYYQNPEAAFGALDAQYSANIQIAISA